MKLVAIVVVAVGLWATGTAVQAQMQMSPAPQIDGSKNPELIPDLVASPVSNWGASEHLTVLPRERGKV